MSDEGWQYADWEASQPRGDRHGFREAFEEPFASGTMEWHHFGGGLSCGTVSAEVRESFEAAWNIGGQGVLTLAFPLAGAYDVRVGDLPQQHQDCSQSWLTRFGRYDASFQVPRGRDLRRFVVAFTPETLLRLFEGRIPRGLLPMLEGEGEAAMCLPFRASSFGFLERAFDPAPTGALREMRAEGLALLALSCAFSGYADAQSGRGCGDERRKLHEARELLLANVMRPPNISQLAQATGLSPWKLTHGFRRLFGMTPGRLLLQARMEMARDLLVSEERVPLKSVAWMVGYTHASSFVNAYTRVFGVSPRRHARRRERSRG